VDREEFQEARRKQREEDSRTERDRATLKVADLAIDGDDCLLLLEMLGLFEVPRDEERKITNADPEWAYYAALGKAIVRARRVAGMTQLELALMLDVSRPSLANIERGAQTVSAYRLACLVAKIGLRPPVL
jgi:DNA-binding XRE family transcriptional regulator